MPISLHFTWDDQVTLGFENKTTQNVFEGTQQSKNRKEGIHAESELGKMNLLYYSATLNSKEQSVFSIRLKI